MRREWLGDALDFWKGAILDVLRQSSPSSLELQVLPMFTDPGWTAPEIKTYAAIIGVAASGILTSACLTVGGRKRYFESVRQHVRGDLFIDPDTGLALGKPKVTHVTCAEATALQTSDNVVAIYQHRPQRVSTPWLATFKAVLVATGCATIGYESKQVGMLFMTKSIRREEALRQALEKRLGPTARPRGGIAGRLI
jgi:hypothetical protein